MDLIITNFDIVYEIFKYLNLNDLLRAAKVSAEFCYAVMEFLHLKYKEIEAFKSFHHYIVSRKISEENNLRLINNNKSSNIIPKCENRFILSYSEYLYFLELNSNNIETLMLHFSDMAGFYHFYYNDKAYFSYAKFNKLKRLGFGDTDLTEDLTNSIIQNCSNLKEIYCSGLLYPDNNESMWFNNKPFKTSDNKKIIKCVGHVDLHSYISHRKRAFIVSEHLISELNSPTGVFNLIIENNTNSKDSKEQLRQLKHCEAVIEGQFAQKQIFDKINQNTFSNLVNLKRLSLVAVSIFNFSKQIFEAFIEKCKHLEYLQLEYCAVKEYIPIESLKELVFYYCFELKANDLLVILSQHTNLNTFTSTLTDYKGKCKLTKISKQLQKLKLRYNEIDHDTMSSIDLKNITSLHWSNAILSQQTWINAENCPNLEILEAKTSHLSLMKINEFKYLKKLILNVSENLNIEEFWFVLKTTTLDYLAIHTNIECTYINYEKYFEILGNNIDNCILNIKFIDICYMDDIDYFNFWLTLLAKNSNLKLRVKYNCHRLEYDYNDDCLNVLCDILNCERFPSSLKTINVCGLNVGVQELLDDFDDASYEPSCVSEDNRNHNKLQYILLENTR